MSDSHSVFVGPDGMSLEEAKALQEKLLEGIATSPVDDKVNAAARLLMSGRYDDCMRAYAAIAAEHPEKRATAEGQIGACMFFLGRYEEAIGHYQKAKELGEDPGMMDDNIQEAQEALAKQNAPAPSSGGSPAASGGTSEKTKQMALILAGAPLAFGFAGVHRIYAGHIGTGILQLLTFGGCGIWQLIDIVQILKGEFKDADGNTLAE